MKTNRFFLLTLLFCCGCGGSKDVGTVEGIVTVDGKSVDRAIITFYPTSGRSSGGYTDENGHYSLVYTRIQKGALIDDHKATISTELEEDYMDGATRDQRDETMPKRYLTALASGAAVEIRWQSSHAYGLGATYG